MCQVRVCVCVFVTEVCAVGRVLHKLLCGVCCGVSLCANQHTYTRTVHLLICCLLILLSAHSNCAVPCSALVFALCAAHVHTAFVLLLHPHHHPNLSSHTKPPTTVMCKPNAEGTGWLYSPALADLVKQYRWV